MIAARNLRPLLSVLILALVACTPEPPQNTSGLEAVTAVPSDMGALPTRSVEVTPTPLVAALPTPPPCPASSVEQAIAALAPYGSPELTEFVRVRDGQLFLGDDPYPLYGAVYVPRDYPGERFLTQSDEDSLQFELGLMRDAGLNTLRVFLRHDDLFICPGNGAVPLADRFERLDTFIRLAANNGFRLILVLNHDPDLVVYPLYAMPDHTEAQLAFIAERYREEAAVMAFDLRDAGDEDVARLTFFYDIDQWLEWATRAVRSSAGQQLVTVSWSDGADVTAPYVDVVSFQHFGSVDALRQEIASLKAVADQPLVVSALGYNTYDQNEIGQRQSYFRALEAIEQNALAGWIVGAAFDHPLPLLCPISQPDCETPEGPATRAGLWNTSYFPKRALDAIQLATGVITRDDIE